MATSRAEETALTVVNTIVVVGIGFWIASLFFATLGWL